MDQQHTSTTSYNNNNNDNNNLFNVHKWKDNLLGKTVGFMDRMSCCCANYYYSSGFNEAEEMEFNVDDFSIVDSVWLEEETRLQEQAQQQQKRERYSSSCAEERDGSAATSEVSGERKPSLRPTLFSNGAKRELSSLKMDLKKLKEEDNNKRPCSTTSTTTTFVTTASTATNTSLQTPPSNSSFRSSSPTLACTTASSGASFTTGEGHGRQRQSPSQREATPQEISVPSPVPSSRRRVPPLEQLVPSEMTRRWSDPSTQESILKIQSDSLVDLPYLSMTEGYRC